MDTYLNLKLEFHAQREVQEAVVFCLHVVRIIPSGSDKHAVMAIHGIVDFGSQTGIIAVVAVESVTMVHGSHHALIGISVQYHAATAVPSIVKMSGSL